MGKHFRESVWNGDKGRPSRERRLHRMNMELESMLSWRELIPNPGPLKPMGPEGLARKLVGIEAQGKGRPYLERSLAAAEEFSNVGDHWRRIVDNGCQKSNNPKGFGRYKQPEPVSVISTKGEMSACYHNQNGNPITDSFKNKYRSRAEYKRNKRKFRKVIDGLTIAKPATQDSAAMAAMMDANEVASGDVSKYFRR